MHEVIQTERLTLRPLTLGDVDEFAHYANDWDVCRMTGTFPYPFPRMSVEGMLDIFMARAAVGRDYHWVIRHGDAFCGVIGVHKRGDVWSLGYWLAKPVWGQGFAGEAIAGIMAHMDKVLGNHRMTAGVFVDNPASAHLLRKAGFERTGPVTDGYSLARRGTSDLQNFERVRTSALRDASGAAPSRTDRMSVKAQHEVS